MKKTKKAAYASIGLAAMISGGLFLNANNGYQPKRDYITEYQKSFNKQIHSHCNQFVELNYSYSSEKETYTEQLVKKFNESRDSEIKRDEKPTGICVRINTEGNKSGKDFTKIYGAKGSGAIMEQAFKRNDIHIISPASSLHLRRYEAKMTDDELYGIDESIVNSPIVIAMWKDMATKLGWDSDPDFSDVSWQKIVDLANDPEGWGKYGKAEWGQFKYGHTSPRKSNSGLMAVIAELMAASKIVENTPTSQLTVEQITDGVQDYVRDLEKSSVRYGKSTGFFAKNLRDNGRDFIHAAVLYESSVIEYKEEIKAKWGADGDIVAVYPLEGTFLSDHPYAVFKRNITSKEQEEGAKAFFDFLLKKENQMIAVNTGFRPARKDIIPTNELPAIFDDPELGVVRDYNQYDISWYNSSISGDVVEFVLNSIWQSIKKESLTYLLIDTSGSMGNRFEGAFGPAISAAEKLVENFTEKDQIKIVPFNYHPEMGYPVINADADGKLQLKRILSRLNSGGGTAYLESIVTSYNEICEASEPPVERFYYRPFRFRDAPKKQAFVFNWDHRNKVPLDYKRTWAHYFDDLTVEESQDVQYEAEFGETYENYVLRKDEAERLQRASWDERQAAAYTAWEQDHAVALAKYEAEKEEARIAHEAKQERIRTEFLAAQEAQMDKIKSIIILTDGEDTESNGYYKNQRTGFVTAQALQDISFDPGKSCHAFVYPITYNVNSEIIEKNFEAVSEASKGKIYSGEKDNITLILDDIASFGN